MNLLVEPDYGHFYPQLLDHEACALPLYRVLFFIKESLAVNDISTNYPGNIDTRLVTAIL